jgi:hypothetical protein
MTAADKAIVKALTDALTSLMERPVQIFVPIGNGMKGRMCTVCGSNWYAGTGEWLLVAGNGDDRGCIKCIPPTKEG